MSEKEPILSEWHKAPEANDEKIDTGYVSGALGKKIGIRRKKFDTQEGEKYYVYKEVLSIEDAEGTLDMYKRLKNANLPVSNFAKIIKKRVNDIDDYSLAMEDHTENGKYELLPIKIAGDSAINEAFQQNDYPTDIKEKMVTALAVLHNNELYDFHPGLSFAIRLEKGKRRILDFLIIDYANFRDKKLPPKTHSTGIDTSYSPDAEMKSDLDTLLSVVSHDADEINMLYSQYQLLRRAKLMKYRR